MTKICLLLKKNYYKTLGLSKSASQSEIKKSYRKLVKQFHPDTARGISKYEAEEALKQINEAYATLSDVRKRRLYDNGGYTINNFGFQTTSGTYTPTSRRKKIELKLAQKENFSLTAFADELRVDLMNLVKILEVMIRKQLVKGKIVRNHFIHLG